MCKTVLASILILIGTSQSRPDQSVPLRGPPIVEHAPILLSSFLPASMQIIAHLTDLMKYELRPSTGVTTTTTIRPTPAHNPGIFGPKNPLGPAAYYSRETSYQDYIQRLKNPPNLGYFDRYRYPVESYEQEFDRTYQNSGSGFSHGQNRGSARGKLLGLPQYNTDSLNKNLELLGQGLSDLLQQVNKLDDYDFEDDDDKVLRFFDHYDDSNFRHYIVGKKKSPPTRAYVTMLSLYDLLNKESKKLQLNKYGGYAPEILRVLAETSTGSAAVQLQTVLSKIVERRDTKDQQIINKINALLKDLEQSDSYLNDALRYIPPLQFTI